MKPVVRAAPADDHTLVTAAQAGDRRALEILLQQHYGRIWKLCRRLAGNDADAQDAAQEALIAIARGLPRFDGRAAFTTWSYRVATNSCLDELRRRSRRPDPVDQNEAPAMTRLVDPTPSPEHVVERHTVDGALRHLPEDYRVAVVLRDLCDLDYAEIGQVLDIPPGTVRSRIARGRAQLADHLRPGSSETGNPPDHPQRPTSQP